MYARELLHALKRSMRADWLAAVLPEGVDDLPHGVEPCVRPGAKGLRRMWADARPLKGVDLVHGLDVAVPLRSGASTVVATVHDLAVFDVPWSFSRRFASAKRVVTAHAMRAADGLVAVSVFTAERIWERFGREASVVPLAPAPDLTVAGADEVEAVCQRYGLPECFVLYVGRVEPRKDVETLARACHRAGAPLVVAGRLPSPGRGLCIGTIHLGYVPRGDLAALYGAATVVGYPSLYEGFGLPPIEALACGTPVVAYRIPPLVELLAAGAVLVPPGDVDRLADALRLALVDREWRAQLVVDGARLARSRTWGDVASDTVAVYRQLGVAC
jgi:glycosyltransferase involved in cell wall biosynthesis